MHCTFARSIRRLFESSNIISIPSGSRLHADVELSAAYLFLCSSVDHTAFHVRQSRRSYQKPSKETRAFVVKSHTGLDTVPVAHRFKCAPRFGEIFIVSFYTHSNVASAVHFSTACPFIKYRHTLFPSSSISPRSMLSTRPSILFTAHVVLRHTACLC